MIVRKNKLGNCNDVSAYTGVQTLEQSLIQNYPCSLASEFVKHQPQKKFKPEQMLRILYWASVYRPLYN